VAANTAGFAAQCPAGRLHTPPDFGSFVRVLPPGTSMSAMQTTSVTADPIEAGYVARPVVGLDERAQERMALRGAWLTVALGVALRLP